MIDHAVAFERKTGHGLDGERILTATGAVVERMVGTELEPAVFNDILAILGRACGASRSYVFKVFDRPDGRKACELCYEWCAPNVSSKKVNCAEHSCAIDLCGTPRWVDRLEQTLPVLMTDADANGVDRHSMIRQRIRSMAVISIHAQGRLWGFAGYDDCVQPRKWSENDLSGLRVFARLTGAAIDRREENRRHEIQQANSHDLLDNLNEGVFRTDDQGRFTYLNRAWSTLIGRPLAEQIGKFCGHLVHPDDRRALRSDFLAMLRGHLPIHRCDLRLLRADGGIRWVHLSVRRTYDAARSTFGLTGTAVDISRNKVVEEQLIKARRDAESANRAKTHFLSTMSHELRTPLNAVIGLSQSLIEGGGSVGPERTKKYLDLIHVSGRQLLAQINDILDVVRVDAGRIHVNVAPFDITRLCSAVLECAARDIRPKTVVTEIRAPARPTVIHADERIVRQVLQNLVTNAMKFTRQGDRVTVTIELPDVGGVIIAVSDTGIGVPPDKQHLLFQPFSQIDSSLSRQFGGTGLGLALVDRLIRLHGGTVAFETNPEGGCVFVVRLPPVVMRSTSASPSP